jgi:hypothetical protein
MRGECHGEGMFLTHLDDGWELSAPWRYSRENGESLGGNRFQILLGADVSDEELGRRVRAQAGMKAGRETLLDIKTWTPTLDAA